MSALITAEVIGAAATAYGAYESGQTASNARSLANSTAGKQNYYNDLLKKLMSNPDSFFDTQVFKSANALGQQAVERKMNSMGYKDSGNILSALWQQGEGFAFGALQNQEEILGKLSGVEAASSPSQLLGASTDAQHQSSSDTNSFVSDINYLAKMYSGKGAPFGGSTAGTSGSFGNTGFA